MCDWRIGGLVSHKAFPVHTVRKVISVLKFLLAPIRDFGSFGEVIATQPG